MIKNKKGEEAPGVNSFLLWAALFVMVLLVVYLFIRYNANIAGDQISFIGDKLGSEATSRG